MNLEHYQYRTNEQSIDYEFESVGPIKKILKVARFSKIGENQYNFGFGDADPTTDCQNNFKFFTYFYL